MAKGRRSVQSAAPEVGQTPNGIAGPSTASLADAELEQARSRLLAKRHSELVAAADHHETAVRELFHLERYVSLVYYDPADAKQRNSDVFQTFQRDYDLFAHPADAQGPTAGSSPRRRTTRGQLTERRSAAIGPQAGSSVHVAPGRKEEAPQSVKKDRKGKAKAVESDPLEDVRTQDVEGGTVEEEAVEEPALVQVKVKAKRGRGRGGMTPRSDRRASGRLAAAPAIAESKALAVAQAAAAPLMPTPKPPPKVPANYVGSGSYKRLRLSPSDPPPIEPTHPVHLTVPKASFSGSLEDLMRSYRSVDDDPDLLPLSKQAIGGKPITRLTMDERIAREAWLRLRIDLLRAEGRLLEPSSSLEGGFNNAAGRRPPPEPEKKARDETHWSHMLSQGLHFGELVKEERGRHQALAKKMSKAVMGYWDRKGNEEEREREKGERERVKRAKWTVREVRKKWRLAVTVVRARLQQEEKEEADRLAKEHLNAILQKSSKALEAQGLDINARSEGSRSRSSMADEEDGGDEEDEEDEEEEEPVDEAEANEGVDEGSQSAVRDGSACDRSREEGGKGRERGEDRVFVNGASLQEGGRTLPSPTLNDTSQSDAAPSIMTVIPPSREDAAPPVTALTSASSRVNGGSNTIVADFDAGDVEFAASDDEARAQADEDWEAQMEDEERRRGEGGVAEEDSDAEMAGLAEDAELPIEELMKKYGYGVNGSAAPNGTDAASSLVPVTDSRALTEDVEVDDAGRAEEGDEGEEVFRVDESADEARDDVDRELEDAMEAEEDESDEAEERGLAADADIPIEELRARYQAMLEADAASSASGRSSAEDEEEYGSEIENVDVMDIDEDGERFNTADAEEGELEDEEAEVVTAVRVPFLLRAQMRPYQKAGLDWLSSLARRGLSGILADEMGLGKTLQCIALLAHLACDRGIWGPHLVVVPTSVMLNWDTEFKKFFPGFKVVTYYGNVKERKEKRRGWNTEGAFHVVVTSYQLVLADQHIFRRKPWYYLVLDEAHHIKNFRSKRWETLLGFNTQRRLLLTGTPLQNNLMELWSLLYFLMPPGMADEDGPFASSDLFREWFSAGTEKAIESGELIDKDTVAKLHTVLRPYLLRRLKADVEKQMPAKHEHILYCRLSKRQRFLYDDYMSRAQTRDTLASGNFMSIINCLMQLRKVCNHPDLFETRPIVTSFALSRAAVADYEVKELLVRKRLLQERPMKDINFDSLQLQLTSPGADAASAYVSSETARLDASDQLGPFARTFAPPGFDESADVPRDTKSLSAWKAYHEHSCHVNTLDRFAGIRRINHIRCRHPPPVLGGAETIRLARHLGDRPYLVPLVRRRNQRTWENNVELLPAMVSSYTERQSQMLTVVSRFAFATPKVFAPQMGDIALAPISRDDRQRSLIEEEMVVGGKADILHPSTVKLTIAFPDRSLLQYDCGKLQELAKLLRRLEEQGSRALIFTQMTKVLDILEEFLTFNGYRYLRLDGSTRVEQRQMLTERFNTDPRIMAFISSTRAGGLGINLTGADTVVFYDNDWNPSMDRQCQDRCHRIGQTRDVHIYRFVSEHTIEENMLRKAEQKRLLDQAVIQQGDFTTDYFAKADWRDMLGGDITIGEGDAAAAGSTKDREVQAALAAAEDEEDAAAAKEAEGETEGRLDGEDFAPEGVGTGEARPSGRATPVVTFAEEGGSATPALAAGADGRSGSEPDGDEGEAVLVEGDDEDDLEGTVDGYMLHWVEEDWDFFGEPGVKW